MQRPPLSSSLMPADAALGIRFESKVPDLDAQADKASFLARLRANNLSNIFQCPPTLSSRSLASPGARQNHLAHLTFNNRNCFVCQPVYSFPAIHFANASSAYRRISCASTLAFLHHSQGFLTC